MKRGYGNPPEATAQVERFVAQHVVSSQGGQYRHAAHRPWRLVSRELRDRLASLSQKEGPGIEIAAMASAVD
jgi:hypothetical protein